MSDELSTNAIPTGVWVRVELVEALRKAVDGPDATDLSMTLADDRDALLSAARRLLAVVDAAKSEAVPLTTALASAHECKPPDLSRFNANTVGRMFYHCLCGRAWAVVEQTTGYVWSPVSRVLYRDKS